MSVPVNGAEVDSFPYMHETGIPRTPWDLGAFIVAHTVDR